MRDSPCGRRGGTGRAPGRRLTLAAIRWIHDAAGYPSPTEAKLVRSTMRGIRRELGVAPKQKAPASVERLAAMVAHASPTSQWPTWPSPVAASHLLSCGQPSSAESFPSV